MKKIRNEHGSILIALVVTMPVVIYSLLAMANYVFILEEKIRLQGVVDAAALAAAGRCGGALHRVQ